jgi:hypothetical protein
VTRKTWRKPEVKAIAAGSAEKGSANNNADGPNPNKS